MSQAQDEVYSPKTIPGTPNSGGALDRFFKLQRNGTTVSREVIAGLTTFAAMAYILVVNPSILKAAGMPQAALVTATALGAAIATTLMGLMANFPLALAPGMGINAFFAFTVCLGMGIPWQSALALVFVNGCTFLLLSVTGVREKIVNALPNSLKARRGRTGKRESPDTVYLRTSYYISAALLRTRVASTLVRISHVPVINAHGAPTGHAGAQLLFKSGKRAPNPSDFVLQSPEPFPQ